MVNKKGKNRGVVNDRPAAEKIKENQEKCNRHFKNAGYYVSNR